MAGLPFGTHRANHYTIRLPFRRNTDACFDVNRTARRYPTIYFCVPDATGSIVTESLDAAKGDSRHALPVRLRLLQRIASRPAMYLLRCFSS